MPLAACHSTPAGLSPSELTPVTSKNASIPTKKIEASGVTSNNQGKYYVISDEEATVYVMDESGVIQTAMPINALHDVDDLESISRLDSKLLVCSSANANKKGILKKKRRRCLLITATGNSFKTQASFDLYKALKHASKHSADKKAREFLKQALKGHALDIEAHAVLNNELLLGFKNPMRKNKTIIMSLGNIQQLLKGQYPPSRLWKTLDFSGEKDKGFHLSDMAFSTQEKLLLTTSGKRSSALWQLNLKSGKLEMLEHFAAAQAEGVTYNPQSHSALLVFDGGNGNGSSIYNYVFR